VEPFDIRLVVGQAAVGDDLDVALARAVVEFEETEAPLRIAGVRTQPCRRTFLPMVSAVRACATVTLSMTAPSNGVLAGVLGGGWNACSLVTLQNGRWLRKAAV